MKLEELPNFPASGELAKAAEQGLLTLRVRAADALLTHYETTHGTVGEHDHHCRAARWSERPHRSGLLILAGPDKGKPLTESYQAPTGQPCTCGWEVAEWAIGRYEEAERAVLSKT